MLILSVFYLAHVKSMNLILNSVGYGWSLRTAPQLIRDPTTTVVSATTPLLAALPPPRAQPLPLLSKRNYVEPAILRCRGKKVTCVLAGQKDPLPDRHGEFQLLYPQTCSRA